MKKILQVRKSVWAVICLCLGLANGYEASAQLTTAQPKIYRTFALDFFKVFGRITNEISFGQSLFVQNVDQPKSAFVDRLQNSSLPAPKPAEGRTTTRSSRTSNCSDTNPLPPLPPVSTLPTPTPPLPVSCTNATLHEVCATTIYRGERGRVSCDIKLCCLRGGKINYCTTVSKYTYEYSEYPTTTYTTCLTHLSCMVM